MNMQLLRNYHVIRRCEPTISQSTIMMEYERKKLKNCADSFQGLAKVLMKDTVLVQEEVMDRQALLLEKRLTEQKELMAKNLEEVAGVMNQVAEHNVRLFRFGERKKKQMIRLLALEGILAKDIYLLDEGRGDYEVCITLRDKKEQNLTVVDIGDYLSVLLDKHLMPTKETEFFITSQYQNFFFREEPRFSVLTGMARATKETEKVSGDSYSFLEIENNQFIAMISDGTGSGEKACQNSEKIIDMAEQFLEAGFGKESTVQMLNDALVTVGEEENMPTLDICGINLYSGECEFLKVGGANTYIKRGCDVETIKATSLPLGMFRSLPMKSVTREIANGDYIIMFSDGVTENMDVEGSEFLKEILKDVPYRSPGEIANFIMKYLLNVKQGRIQDDMTILVMGLWENNLQFTRDL